MYFESGNPTCIRNWAFLTLKFKVFCRDIQTVNNNNSFSTEVWSVGEDNRYGYQTDK